MIAIIVTDVILLAIYLSKILASPMGLISTAVITRFFMFIFGSTYWIYGYMIIYIYYGTILSFVIGNKRFPFEKAYANMNINKLG